MPEHTHSLEDLEIFEVSLVDDPANTEAKVSLFKRAPRKDEMPEQEQIPEEHIGLFKRFLKFLQGDNSEAIETPEETPAEVVKVVEMSEDKEDVAKADREALTKALAGERAEREALAKRLAGMEAVEKRREAVSKAQKEMPSLPAKAEDVADVLTALEQCSPEVAKKAEEILKAASAALGEAKLFSEIGDKGADDSSAIAKLNASADRIRADNPKLSREQAFMKALEINPELDAQYRAEARKGA